MKNKILIIIISILLSIAGFGQIASVTIADYQAAPGVIDIPVEVADFSNVAAISIYVEYDETVMVYDSYLDGGISGASINTTPTANGYMLGIAWYSLTPLNFTGTLLTLRFNYLGGSSALDLKETLSEISDFDATPIPTNYYDGSISPDQTVPVEIVDQLNQLPSPPNLVVPINADFSGVALGVGAFNFEIAYDESKLIFQQALNFFDPAIEINVLSNPARIAIVWLTTDPVSGSQHNGKLLDLEFTYAGGNADLTFQTAACAISDYNANVLNTSYLDGTITQDPATMPNITIGSTTGVAGTPVTLPVTVANFSNIGSFDFQIDYDPLALAYTSVTNVNPAISANLDVNSLNNSLFFAWFSTSGGLNLNDDDILFELNFDYFGSNTDVVFNEPNCNMADWGASPVYGFYTNGTVTETAGTNTTVCMQTVLSQQLNEVLMPVTVTGFNDIGAITLEIQFDQSLANFVAVENKNALLSEGSDLFTIIDGLLTYSWTVNESYGSGITLSDNDKLFDIRFYYITGTVPITFNNFNCDIANFETVSLDVFYCDGEIRQGGQLNLKVYLEGLYNNSAGQMNKAKDYDGSNIVDKFSGTVADKVDIELHSATNYATVLYSFPDQDLNQDGTVTITLPDLNPASYYITVKNRNHLETVSATAVDFSTGNVSYDFTTGANQAYGNNQQLLGSGIYGVFTGDVDQNGVVNVTDRTLIDTYIYNLVVGYFAEDIDGNGVINVSDRTKVDVNLYNIVEKNTPPN